MYLVCVYRCDVCVWVKRSFYIYIVRLIFSIIGIRYINTWCTYTNVRYSCVKNHCLYYIQSNEWIIDKIVKPWLGNGLPVNWPHFRIRLVPANARVFFIKNCLWIKLTDKKKPNNQNNRIQLNDCKTRVRKSIILIYCIVESFATKHNIMIITAINITI